MSDRTTPWPKVSKARRDDLRTAARAAMWKTADGDFEGRYVSWHPQVILDLLDDLDAAEAARDAAERIGRA